MAEIRTTLRGFRAIVKKTGNTIFESKECVVTSRHGLLVKAYKNTKNKIFASSLPLLSVGYSGISSASYDADAEEMDIETLLEILESLGKTQLTEVKERIEKLLK